MHLYEKQLNSEVIHKGKIITLTVDDVELENNKSAKREVVHHNGGVAIVPITDNNEIIFVNQFRYPYNTVITEIPAGKIDPGEDHLTTGKRELLEETGCTAESFEYLGVMYPSTGYLTEKIHMYLARGLSYKSQHLDEDEFIDIIKIPFDKAVEMIMAGELPDAKTQIAVLKTARLLKR